MTKKQIETAEGQVIEQQGVLFFKVNRAMSWLEYEHLRAKVDLEEARSGQKIIIVPHAVDVVKS